MEVPAPTPTSPPTVTVAVPLHRSAPWVDTVLQNVRNLPDEVTEIVLSDRTCVDGAASRLATLLGDDPRVVVVAEETGLGWAEHFQLLLEEAHGDLFMWMPHDDHFAPSWVPTLVQALLDHPTAWLAFGHMDCVQLDGTTPAGTWPHPPPGLVQGWGVLRMMLQGEMGVPFRGLFRRREVLASDLRMAPSDRMHGVDMLWAFSLGLQSAMVYDDRTTTLKRFYATSTYASWGAERPGVHEAETLRLLREHGPGGLHGAAMRAVTRLAWVRGRLRPWLGPTWRRMKAIARRKGTAPPGR